MLALIIGFILDFTGSLTVDSQGKQRTHLPTQGGALQEEAEAAKNMGQAPDKGEVGLEDVKVVVDVAPEADN